MVVDRNYDSYLPYYATFGYNIMAANVRLVVVTVNSQIKKILENRLIQYKYNVVLRTSIELYLDLALYSFIGLLRYSFNDTIRGFSTGISILLFVSFLKSNYF